ERLWKQLVMSPTPDAADDSPNTARAHTVVVLILTVTAALAVKIPDLLMRFFSEHPGITLVGANMVAMWLPFGAHFQEASGSCGYADRLGMPRNASECPCYIIRQGRNPCPTCDVPHIRESPVLIGTNATLVVAPTGFEPVFQP
ncbi:MAG TPA: hypothetical protein VHF87_04665, partial [Methylomirabilota bacterium]|nr:hypothetical protein [Methylomirabilota bacterium]